MDGYAHTPATTKRLAVSRPGTPTDNLSIEAFNGRFQQKCLDQNWFASLNDARTIIAAWRKDYNTVRPHTAIANLTPAAYKANRVQQLRLSGNGKTADELLAQRMPYVMATRDKYHEFWVEKVAKADTPERGSTP